MLASVIRDHENIVNKSRDRIKRLEQKTATSAAKYSKGSLSFLEYNRQCLIQNSPCV